MKIDGVDVFCIKLSLDLTAFCIELQLDGHIKKRKFSMLTTAKLMYIKKINLIFYSIILFSYMPLNYLETLICKITISRIIKYIKVYYKIL